MTAIVRFGGFLSPVIAGLAWDHIGVWGAFLAMSAWAACGFAAVLMIPAPRNTEAARRQQTPVRAADLVPRISDYIEAFRLTTS